MTCTPKPADLSSSTVDSSFTDFLHCPSISAEHGIGLTKKPYLAFTRSAEEIAVMRLVKCAFDPRGVLNPGKVFDVD
jgi:hypothetical protein